MLRAISFLIAALFFASGGAFAQATPPAPAAPGPDPALAKKSAQRHGGFDRADANHDGRVTLDEYVAFRERAHVRASRRIEAELKETDLTQAERDDLLRRQANEQRFAQLTPDQKQARLKSDFARHDRNGDGAIDPAEWRAPRGRDRQAQQASQPSTKP